MKRKQTLVIGVVCGIALIIIALKYAGGFWPFRAINDSILNPLGSSVASVGRGFKQSFEILTKATELSKQNKQQSQEILELKNQLASLKEIANENEQISTIENPRFLKTACKKIEKLQKDFSRKKLKSNNRKKAKIH